jgi:predicted amidohydrolase
MNIALIQSSIWENPDAKVFENKINSISAEVNLIALPEMFTYFCFANRGCRNNER